MENKTETTTFDFSENMLVHAPHDALITQVPEFDETDPEYRRALAAYMTETMAEHNGIGLAANQINLNASVFVMSKDGQTEFVINPAIHSVSKDKVLMLEGCLSEPGLFMKITRPAAVRCSWESIDGERNIYDLTGWAARVFLHEYDHLQGIMFTDRVTRPKLDLARKKQKKALGL